MNVRDVTVQRHRHHEFIRILGHEIPLIRRVSTQTQLNYADLHGTIELVC